jgi:cobalt-zinc-cadmium resistance protein CzcA
MIKRLVHFALHQPLFLVMMAVLFVGGGLMAFKSLPIEAFPDVSDIQVNVIALYPGRAPEEVEKQVTIPLEIVLSGLPHQVRMFSHTQFGLSFLMLTFDDKVNDYFARQQVFERLSSAKDRIPAGFDPSMGPITTGTGQIYLYQIVGRGKNAHEVIGGKYMKKMEPNK